MRVLHRATARPTTGAMQTPDAQPIDHDALFARAGRAATSEECSAIVAEITLALERTGDPGDRGRLLMCRARVRSNEWRTAEVCADTRAAMEQFDRAGEREMALDAASWTAAHASRLGELALAADLATRSLLALDAGIDDRLRMEIHNRLGIFCISFLDYHRAVEQFELSLEVATRIGDQEKVWRQLHNVADGLLLACRHARVLQADSEPGILDRAEAAVRELHMRASDDFARRTGCDRLAAEVLCERGQAAEALRVLASTRARASVTAPVAQRAALAWIHARSLRLAGHAATSVAEAERAVATARAGHDPHDLMLALDELSASREAAGDLAGALAAAREVNACLSRIHQIQTRQLVAEVWARADLMRDRLHLVSQAEQANRWAELDALTGMGNRRLLERFISQAIASDHTLTLIIVDLDRFKEINDGHGHDVGDAVLRRVAEVLAHEVRAGQVSTRYGGDEFVLGLLDVEVGAAVGFAERLRRTIEDVDWGGVAPGLAVTATVGLAAGPAGASQAVFSAADAALYAAKRAGRNAVFAASGQPGTRYSAV